jgi:hypothetical protein
MSRRYRATLEAISQRTGTSLPSLALSFGILHEITAIVPLVGIFYSARYLGVGERAIQTITYSDSDSWVSQKAHTYISDGELWAGRVGRRYGLFGYEKRDPSSPKHVEDEEPVPAHLAGDIANAVFAYGATKALVPARIGLSLWLSPAFARALVDPIGRSLGRVFKALRKAP